MEGYIISYMLFLLYFVTAAYFPLLYLCLPYGFMQGIIKCINQYLSVSLSLISLFLSLYIQIPLEILIESHKSSQSFYMLPLECGRVNFVLFSFCMVQ